jgi:hypothetical protein
MLRADSGTASRSVGQAAHCAPESKTPREPFDLGRAVEANYRRLMMSSPASTKEPIFSAPRGGGLIFQGSQGTACRPLLHAAPLPRDLEAALSWCRLLLFIDAA